MNLLGISSFDEDGNLNVVVEAPRGAEVKLIYEPRLGSFVFQRQLPVGLAYPYDWGFVPSTHAEDGDPLDAMVLLEGRTWPGVVLPSTPIGIVRVVQRDAGKSESVHNDRIIAVPAGSKRHGDVADLAPSLREELERFFVAVGRQKHEHVEVERWDGPAAAMKSIERAARAFSKR